MRFSDSFLCECRRFEKHYASRHDQNAEGLRQFHEFESKGLRPSVPNAYFERLLNGKKWWEWQLNEMAKLRFTDEWPGWMQLRMDFRGDDPGFRQLMDRCMIPKAQQQKIIEETGSLCG